MSWTELLVGIAVPAIYWGLRAAQARLDQRLYSRLTGRVVAPVVIARRRKWDVAVTILWLVAVVSGAMSE